MQYSYRDVPAVNNDFAVVFDSLTLKQEGMAVIQEPVITSSCNHTKQVKCLSFKEALEQIKEKKYAQCECGQRANSIDQLRKDILGIAQNNFHPLTESIQLIQGIMTHKYVRSQKYIEILSKAPEDQQIQNFVKTLYEKYHISNSISQFIKNQGFQGSNYTFWAYCLLDKIKIIIPVRILDCQHPQCYELTSLLTYQSQQVANKDQVSQTQIGKDQDDIRLMFHCSYPGCFNKIDIQSLPIMFSKLVIDQELLNLLNSAPPIQFKFTYDLKNKCFLKDFQSKDPYIVQILGNIEDIAYNSLMIQIQKVMQSDFKQEIQDILNEQKYQKRKIDLIDPLNHKQVEFPVRCIKCTDYNRCADIRTYLAHYVKTKEQKQKVIEFKCPLCKNILTVKNQNLSLLIYFDQNIISRMFKDSNENNHKEFLYEGKEYMLEEFKSKQKFSKDDYQRILKKKKDADGNFIKEVLFNKLKCTLNPQQKLQNPLIIKNCKDHSFIDFDTFYQKLVECKFKLSQDGIILCKCSYCSMNPIKQITTCIFYHEALGEALLQLKNDEITPEKFKYNFEENKFILVSKRQTQEDNLDQIIIEEGKSFFRNGFVDLLSDKDYKEVFQPKRFGGKLFQIHNMKQDIIIGLEVEHNSEGFKINIEKKIDSFNINANQDLKKFNFQLNGMKVEMEDDIIAINKGAQWVNYDVNAYQYTYQKQQQQ